MILKEIVTIEDIEQNKVKVRFEKSKMCSCCRLSFLCGKQGQEQITIDNPGLSLAKGDKIEVGIERKKPLLASVLLFFFPGVIFIATLVIFHNIKEILSFVLAITSVIIYFIILKCIMKKKEAYFKLKILRKV
ncbi:MAG: SoxR reducing system RseC family protein [Candidatus Omnitrophota bacterium]|nr:MAG: SoxR reducing system RseC family protein [Candidatus Omnitrophota bacterium]